MVLCSRSMTNLETFNNTCSFSFTFLERQNYWEIREAGYIPRIENHNRYFQIFQKIKRNLKNKSIFPSVTLSARKHLISEVRYKSSFVTLPKLENYFWTKSRFRIENLFIESKWEIQFCQTRFSILSDEGRFNENLVAEK